MNESLWAVFNKVDPWAEDEFAFCHHHNVTYNHRVNDEGENEPQQCAPFRASSSDDMVHTSLANTCTCTVRRSVDSLTAYADHFNWCVVPDKSYDAVLFGAMAVVVAVVLQGKYSALWTLIAGMALSSCPCLLCAQSTFYTDQWPQHPANMQVVLCKH